MKSYFPTPIADTSPSITSSETLNKEVRKILIKEKVKD